MILAIIIVILSKAIVSSGSQRVWDFENRVVHEILAHLPALVNKNHHPGLIDDTSDLNISHCIITMSNSSVGT